VCSTSVHGRRDSSALPSHGQKTLQVQAVLLLLLLLLQGHLAGVAAAVEAAGAAHGGKAGARQQQQQGPAVEAVQQRVAGVVVAEVEALCRLLVLP
jgi:hypothetical protein